MKIGELNLEGINSGFISSFSDFKSESLSEINENEFLFEVDEKFIIDFNNRNINYENLSEIITICDYLMIDDLENFIANHIELSKVPYELHDEFNFKLPKFLTLNKDNEIFECMNDCLFHDNLRWFKYLFDFWLVKSEGLFDFYVNKLHNVQSSYNIMDRIIEYDSIDIFSYIIDNLQKKEITLINKIKIYIRVSDIFRYDSIKILKYILNIVENNVSIEVLKVISIHCSCSYDMAKDLFLKYNRDIVKATLKIKEIDDSNADSEKIEYYQELLERTIKEQRNYSKFISENSESNQTINTDKVVDEFEMFYPENLNTLEISNKLYNCMHIAIRSDSVNVLTEIVNFYGIIFQFKVIQSEFQFNREDSYYNDFRLTRFQCCNILDRNWHEVCKYPVYKLFEKNNKSNDFKFILPSEIGECITFNANKVFDYLYENRIEIFNFNIDTYNNVQFRIENFRTLELALLNTNTHVAKLLLDNGIEAPPLEYNNTCGKMKVLEFYLKNDLKIDEKFFENLLLSCEINDLIVSLKLGLKPNGNIIYVPEIIKCYYSNVYYQETDYLSSISNLKTFENFIIYLCEIVPKKFGINVIFSLGDEFMFYSILMLSEKLISYGLAKNIKWNPDLMNLLVDYNFGEFVSGPIDMYGEGEYSLYGDETIAENRLAELIRGSDDSSMSSTDSKVDESYDYSEDLEILKSFNKYRLIKDDFNPDELILNHEDDCKIVGIFKSIYNMENVTKNNYVLPMFFTKLDRFNITCKDDVTGYNYLSDELKQKFDKLIFLKNTIHVDLLNYLINSNYKISYYSFFGMIDSFIPKKYSNIYAGNDGSSPIMLRYILDLMNKYETNLSTIIQPYDDLISDDKKFIKCYCGENLIDGNKEEIFNESRYINYDSDDDSDIYKPNLSSIYHPLKIPDDDRNPKDSIDRYISCKSCFIEMKYLLTLNNRFLICPACLKKDKYFIISNDCELFMRDCNFDPVTALKKFNFKMSLCRF